MVRLLSFVALGAVLVWLLLTVANEAAGLQIMPGGGFFTFPEIRFEDPTFP